MADSGEAFEVGGVKPKKGWIIRRFDDQRVFEINHDISPYFPFKPAALNGITGTIVIVEQNKMRGQRPWHKL